MQAGNHLGQALKSGRTSFGLWQMLHGSNLARTLARTGVDWVCVDTEHGNFDDAQMHEAVAAIAGCGTASPLVRIAASEGWMVKRALDAGAHGIVVPLLRTAEEAAAIVSAAKFPPVGIRGFGSPFAQSAFGAGCTNAIEYLQQANDSLLTIIQIETREALDNVDAIAKVPGVDVLFIGPFDLGIAIGRPITDGTMHDELKQAVGQILTAAKENGKACGIFCMTGEHARMCAAQGFQMISVTWDMFAIPTFVGEQLKVAKGTPV